MTGRERTPVEHLWNKRAADAGFAGSEFVDNPIRVFDMVKMIKHDAHHARIRNERFKRFVKRFWDTDGLPVVEDLDGDAWVLKVQEALIELGLASPMLERCDEGCNGTGWIITNPDWPHGAQPYRERCPNGCEETVA